MRVEDAQGGEGVVLRQSLERACRGVKQILVLAKLFEALLAAFHCSAVYLSAGVRCCE